VTLEEVLRLLPLTFTLDLPSLSLHLQVQISLRLITLMVSADTTRLNTWVEHLIDTLLRITLPLLQTLFLDTLPLFLGILTHLTTLTRILTRPLHFPLTLSTRLPESPVLQLLRFSPTLNLNNLLTLLILYLPYLLHQFPLPSSPLNIENKSPSRTVSPLAISQNCYLSLLTLITTLQVEVPLT